MLDLVTLDGVVLLPLGLVLKLGRLLLSKLHHHQALHDSVQLVLQHYHTFEVDLSYTEKETTCQTREHS